MVRWRSGTVAAVRRAVARARWSSTSTCPTAAPSARWPTRRWSASRSRATGCCSTSARSRWAWAPAGTRSWWRCPTGCRPTRRRTATTRDAGHLVKARYTPLQTIVLGVDEEASPHRAVLADADDLDGMPVVTADLHSALPAILAGMLADAPGRAGGVRDDRRRRAAGLVLPHPRRAAPTGSPARSPSGQAFGGDLEAVTVHSGLLAARHVLARRRRRRRPGPGQPRHRHARGASPASRSARRSTRPPRWAAGRSARCASPTPTPGPATAASRTTASPRTAGWRSPPADLVAARRAWTPALAGRSWTRRWPRCASGTGSSRSPPSGLDAGAARLAGAAVDDGPRPRRRPRLLPGRRGGRPARGAACSA